MKKFFALLSVIAMLCFTTHSMANPTRAFPTSTGAAFLQNRYAQDDAWRTQLLSDMLSRMQNYQVSTLILSGPGLTANGHIQTLSSGEISKYKDFLARVRAWENTHNYYFELMIMFNGDVSSTSAGTYVDYWGGGTGTSKYSALTTPSDSPQRYSADDAVRFISPSGDVVADSFWYGANSRAFNGVFFDVEPSGGNHVSGCNAPSGSNKMSFDCLKNVGKVVRARFVELGISATVGVAAHMRGTSGERKWLDEEYYYAARNFDIIIPMMYDQARSSAADYMTYVSANMIDIVKDIGGERWGWTSHPAPSIYPRIYWGTAMYDFGTADHNPNYENAMTMARAWQYYAKVPSAQAAALGYSFIAGMAAFSVGSGCKTGDSYCAGSSGISKVPSYGAGLTEPVAANPGKVYGRFAVLPFPSPFPGTGRVGYDWDQWCYWAYFCPGIYYSGGTRYVAP